MLSTCEAREGCTDETKASKHDNDGDCQNHPGFATWISDTRLPSKNYTKEKKRMQGLRLNTKAYYLLTDVVDTQSNNYKSLGVGAKDLPLTPTVIQGMVMFGNNVADITRDLSTSTMSPINCTTVVYAFPEEDRVVVGYINEWINAYSFISKNQEKFYLYIIVSVTAGILIFLGLVIGRLLVSRHRAKRDAKFHANNEALPNGFTDDISEIDADIDLTTPVPVPMQDTRIPETQLAERLHGDRYYADTRIPLSPTSIHPPSGHHATNTGVRVDLGNHMVGTDSLHTILRPENPRSLTTKSYYYG
ncbi:hypothetical protein WN55_02181 [Dufourea novaeangliae]|uniref:Uncharacterized protein n=1 Tax=Dufourea novaeangliae TaxID=178035 RepID=A0A154NXK3_DUFNO|nr:hypothetical protein WN55_02181 [Dufourea novaeangliae]